MIYFPLLDLTHKEICLFDGLGFHSGRKMAKKLRFEAFPEIHNQIARRIQFFNRNPLIDHKSRGDKIYYSLNLM